MIHLSTKQLSGQRLVRPLARLTQPLTQLVRIGAVMAIAAASLGTTTVGNAGTGLTAKASALSAPVAAAPAPAPTPVVQQEVVAVAATPAVVAVAKTYAAAPTPRVVRSSGGGGGDVLGRIRNCESHGNYAAVSRSGKYRGAYQFDQRTWQGVGGSGDPAAASPAEQDARAAALYARRGGSPWPVCSRR